MLVARTSIEYPIGHLLIYINRQSIMLFDSCFGPSSIHRPVLLAADIHSALQPETLLHQSLLQVFAISMPVHSETIPIPDCVADISDPEFTPPYNVVEAQTGSRKIRAILLAPLYQPKPTEPPIVGSAGVTVSEVRKLTSQQAKMVPIWSFSASLIAVLRQVIVREGSDLPIAHWDLLHEVAHRDMANWVSQPTDGRGAPPGADTKLAAQLFWAAMVLVSRPWQEDPIAIPYGRRLCHPEGLETTIYRCSVPHELTFMLTNRLRNLIRSANQVDANALGLMALGEDMFSFRDAFPSTWLRKADVGYVLHSVFTHRHEKNRTMIQNMRWLADRNVAAFVQALHFLVRRMEHVGRQIATVSASKKGWKKEDGDIFNYEQAMLQWNDVAQCIRDLAGPKGVSGERDSEGHDVRPPAAGPILREWLTADVVRGLNAFTAGVFAISRMDFWPILVKLSLFLAFCSYYNEPWPEWVWRPMVGITQAIWRTDVPPWVLALSRKVCGRLEERVRWFEIASGSLHTLLSTLMGGVMHTKVQSISKSMIEEDFDELAITYSDRPESLPWISNKFPILMNEDSFPLLQVRLMSVRDQDFWPIAASLASLPHPPSPLIPMLAGALHARLIGDSPATPVPVAAANMKYAEYAEYLKAHSGFYLPVFWKCLRDWLLAQPVDTGGADTSKWAPLFVKLFMGSAPHKEVSYTPVSFVMD